MCVVHVTKMLQVQPHINAVNEHGNTPLHYACFWGYERLCEVSVVQHKYTHSRCLVKHDTTCTYFIID